MNLLRKPARCAVYTRKSTDHNLDLEFNSLDAQREACEAYIKSQAHEGWRLVPDPFDDGGISGGSLERPALQALLLEIQRGKIDIVVVYKVDRLTRSLADFAKLVELFDQHGVSFVSITQAFNTTTSMGRLTLNVLLSFAQFEREVIGERVRDKISASKRKGIWVGGPIPLGYVSVNKKLAVVPEEAEAVRAIFRRYLELGSVRLLSADLDNRGIRTKRRVLASGAIVGNGRFGVGALSHFLKNRFYIGEIAYRGEIHLGEHEPILDRVLFEEVQTKLAAKNVERRMKLKSSAALLSGRIYDDRGNRMTPSHTTKKGVRYRYYVSNAVLQKRDSQVGFVSRVPAPEIEELIVQALKSHLIDEGWPEGEEKRLGQLERVVLHPDVIQIYLRQSGLPPLDEASGEDTCAIDLQNPLILSLPWAPSKFIAVKGVICTPQDEVSAPSSEVRDAMLTAIAKARKWIDDLMSGRIESIEKIAQSENKGVKQIQLLASLAFVSPGVVQDLIQGNVHVKSVTELARNVPWIWSKPLTARHGQSVENPL